MAAAREARGRVRRVTMRRNYTLFALFAASRDATIAWKYEMQ